MMLWCEIHGAAGSMKGSVTNYDLSEYEKDIAWLTNITQVMPPGGGGVFVKWIQMFEVCTIGNSPGHCLAHKHHTGWRGG
jgi:hypothetical protein